MTEAPTSNAITSERFRQRLDALEKAEREGLVKLPPDV